MKDLFNQITERKKNRIPLYTSRGISDRFAITGVHYNCISYFRDDENRDMNLIVAVINNIFKPFKRISKPGNIRE